MSDFSIRPMRESDESFIYKAWLEGYWPHFPGNIIIPKGEFMWRWHGIIERILADEKTRTVVAHVDGQPDTLLGFACGFDRGLHWAYVKQAFRGLWICHGMLDVVWRDLKAPISMTHHSLYVDGVNFEYAPELLKEYA